MTQIIKLPWDDYQITDYLGSGGFASVYKAVNTNKVKGSEGFYSAVKIVEIPKDKEHLNKIRSNDPFGNRTQAILDNLAEETMQEVAVMSELSEQHNPNIVEMYDFSHPNPEYDPELKIMKHRIFIREALLEPLDHLTPTGQLDEETIIHLGIDIANALMAVEEIGVIHRDISPSNILFSKSAGKMIFQLTDFGIARKLEEKVAVTSKKTPGKSFHIPPEAASEQPIFTNTYDIYGLGVTLYYLSNNNYPLVPDKQILSENDYNEANNFRINNEKPIPKPDNISDALASVILKAISFNTEDRFQCAEEMKIALLECRNEAKSTREYPKTQNRLGKYKTLNPKYSVLREKLLKRLQDIRKNHSSFKLMNAVDPLLYPNGVVMLSSELTGEYEGQEYKFHDIVEEIWKKHQSNVLFIKGDGGTGKTVSLLTFATEGGICEENIPAVYIPMYELNDYCGNRDNCITEYLKNHEDYCEYYNDIKKLADSEWEENPNFILLLDGMNEVYNSCTDEIRSAIETWTKKSGVFVVCTSRFLDQEIEDPVVFTLNHLTRETAHDYLVKVLGGDDAPALNGPVYGILDTPLMLNLYTQTQQYRKIYRADFYDWHEPDTEIDIVWNYFQKELARCRETQKKNNNEISFMECAMLVLWVAPFVCYKMEQQNIFEIPADDKDRNKPSLNRYIKEAYDAYLSLDKYSIPNQIRNIENQLRKHVTLVKPEDDRYDQKLFDYFYYLTDSMAIFCKKQNGNAYTLMHQNFRDGMAAMFLKNVIVIGVNEGKVPVEMKISVSEYVKNYLADLENEDEMLKLWELIQRENIAISNLYSYLPETEITLLHNFLRTYGQITGNNFVKLSFSRMNLKGFNLYSYRKEDNNMLLVSHDPSAFDKSQLSLDNFKPQGHTGAVYSVNFSSNSRRIVSGSNDGTIRVWDAETHQQIGDPLIGHTEGVTSITLSSDGRRIVSGSYDGTIRVWDAETHQQIGDSLIGHTEEVTSITLSSDGRRIVSGSYDGTIRLWDAETHQQIGLPIMNHNASMDYANYSAPINCVTFSSDGRRIVSGSYDGTIRLWDAETHQQIGDPFLRHTSFVHSIVFNSNDQRIVSGSNDGTIRLWDAGTHRQIGLPIMNHNASLDYANYPASINSVTFSSDGRRIVSGSNDGTIRVWDAETHQQIGDSLIGHTEEVTSITLSSDGRRIVSGSNDGTIRLWDAETHQQIGFPIGYPFRGISSMAFSSDGRRIASGCHDRTIRIWDTETYRQIGRPFGGNMSYVCCIAFSRDGQRIVSGAQDGTIKIWDAETHQQIGTDLKRHMDVVYSVEFSPNGERIVSGSGDGTARLWDTKTSQQIALLLDGDIDSTYLADTYVSFSLDGKNIYSYSDAGLITWDAETLEEISMCFDGELPPLDFPHANDPTGKKMTHTSGNTIEIYDAGSHELIKIIEVLFGVDISNLDFSKAILSDHDREIFRQNGVIVSE